MMGPGCDWPTEKDEHGFGAWVTVIPANDSGSRDGSDYRWRLYFNDLLIADGYAEFHWHARRQARKALRRYHKRKRRETTTYYL